MKRASKKSQQKAFLNAFRVCGVLARAAEAAGVSRVLHYTWLKDPEYAEKFEEASREANETLEAEAVRRAAQGVRRMKFYKGQPIMVPCEKDDPGAIHVGGRGRNAKYVCPYIEHEYSDTLLIFLMKGRDRDKWGDKSHVTQEIVGTDKTPSVDEEVDAMDDTVPMAEQEDETK